MALEKITREYLEKQIVEYKLKAEELKNNSNAYNGAWQALERILKDIENEPAP